MKRISYDYDEQTGSTIAKLVTKQGTFYGTADYNEEEETLPPSYMFGMRLAEDRAYIKYYKCLLNQAKEQLRGLKRAEAAVPADKKEALHYIHGAMSAVDLEKSLYEDAITMLEHDLEQAIKDRKLYIRSRSATREEKEQQKKAIKQAFKTLSQVKQDKND